jgi:large subunit ribosomal protein L33
MSKKKKKKAKHTSHEYLQQQSHQMSSRKKLVRVIKMVSQANTGFFYTTEKNPKLPKKLVLLKYDPVVNQRVLFKVRKEKMIER